MPTYLIGQIEDVSDPAGFDQYREKVGPVIEQYGGRYRAVGAAEQKEGTWKPGVFVLIEFHSQEQARSWYDSAEYQPLKELRQRSARSNIVFLNGM